MAPGGNTVRPTTVCVEPTVSLVISHFKEPRAYVSLDGGATMREFPIGPATPISDFASNSAGVFAGTRGSGVYVWR